MYTHTCTRALGVLFQFQNNFTVTQANRRYVESLSRRLAEDITMAVEFRHRSWFDDVHVASTTSWLAALRHDGAALVASDDLEHEIAQPDRQQWYESDAFHAKLETKTRNNNNI